jgi:hypothetical protein
MKHFFLCDDSLRKQIAVFAMCVVFFVFSTVFARSAHALTRPERVEFSQGVARAISCEGDIDDDLSAYRDCISHALAPRTTSEVSQLGVRFQAWIIADLMSRQHATGSAAFAMVLRDEIQRTVRSRRIAIDVLCRLKSIPCDAVIRGLKTSAVQPMR